MGGYGVLRLGEVRPGWLRAVAAFSPDVTHSQSVANDDGVYRTTPLGVWCGRSDPLYGDVRAFVSQLPRRPQVLSYGGGAHTRAYWDISNARQELGYTPEDDAERFAAEVLAAAPAGGR